MRAIATVLALTEVDAIHGNSIACRDEIGCSTNGAVVAEGLVPVSFGVKY